jgi:hypothetical protein
MAILGFLDQRKDIYVFSAFAWATIIVKLRQHDDRNSEFLRCFLNGPRALCALTFSAVGPVGWLHELKVVQNKESTFILRHALSCGRPELKRRPRAGSGRSISNR